MWPSDPLEHCLVSSSSMEKEVGTLDYRDKFYAREEAFLRCVFSLEALQCDTTLKSSNENLEAVTQLNLSNDGLILKQLPEHLYYAFLGEDSTLQVIITTSFSKDNEEKLLVVLRSHKSAL